MLSLLKSINVSISSLLLLCITLLLAYFGHSVRPTAVSLVVVGGPLSWPSFFYLVSENESQ